MSEYKKQTPAQQRERLQWQLDAIREKQAVVGSLLLICADSAEWAPKELFEDMHKSDRDAILQPGGIFTDEQLKILSPERFVQDTETDK